jgi:hypothetical protein
MAQNKADFEPDMKTAKDREEPLSLMEPLLIGDASLRRAPLPDVALELAQKSAGFRHGRVARLMSDATMLETLLGEGTKSPFSGLGRTTPAQSGSAIEMGIEKFLGLIFIDAGRCDFSGCAGLARLPVSRA